MIKFSSTFYKILKIFFIVAIVITFTVTFSSDVRAEPCGGFVCGACPSDDGSTCGPSEDWCCCNEGCTCLCDNNQCNTNSGWDATCPFSACCGGNYGEPEDPRCALSGDTNICAGDSGNYSALCTDGDGDLNRIVIVRVKTNKTDWLNIADCNFGNTSSSTCSTSYVWPAPAENYYAYVIGDDARAAPSNRCTGNPFCPWPPVALPQGACTGREDCGPDDVININVSVCEPPAPVLTETQVCSPSFQNELDWNAVDRADIYEVQRCTGAGCGAFLTIAWPLPPTTAYTDTTAAAGVTYRYRVRARDNFVPVSGGWSNIVTILFGCTPPKPVAAVSMSCSPLRAVVDWDPVANADRYQVQRCTGAGCNGWAWIATVLSPTTIYTDNTVVFGNVYRYRVRGRVNNIPVNGAWSDPMQVDTRVCMPAAPTLAGVASCTPLQAELEWWIVLFADDYEVQRCTGVGCSVSPWSTIAIFTPPLGFTVEYIDTTVVSGEYYEYQVRGIDNDIPADGAWSNPVGVSFVGCVGNIVGWVYEDDNGNARIPPGPSIDRCGEDLDGGVNGPSIVPGASSAVNVNPGGYKTNDPGGSLTAATGYVVPNVPFAAPGSYIASLTGYDSNYTCSCPTGCAYGLAADIGSPDTELNFYVTELRAGWAQTVGGDVYSAGSIDIEIPTSCTPANSCQPYFTLATAGQDPGVLYSASGVWDFAPGGSASSDPLKTWQVESSYNVPPSTKYGYDFWRNQFDDSEINTAQYLGCTLGSKPPSVMNDVVFEITCNSDLTLTGANWKIINKRFIFFINFADPVNQKLILDPGPNNDNANKKSITVRNNSYLMFITNGDIEVADTIERADGIYLTDRTYSTCQNSPCGYDSGTGDKYRLEVEGSVIAWGGDGSLGDAVKLQRDLYTDNFNTPGELFTYRQDVIDLLPRKIQTVPLLWEEVPP